jgi:GNAT superfamily N-acetyltransferase
MLTIRPATANDATLLRELIYELAEFERERHMVTITEADLLRDGFGAKAKFRALIAEWSGQTAGYALFYGCYSTWEGRPGLFLEDVFVRSPYRSSGIGKALLTEVARIAQVEQCYGVRWEVLHWNQAAIEFYQKLGATFLDQWKSMVLTGKALERVASTSS